jgi:FKBP-type peptidyl-prolyl cis-trans isomerase
LGVLAVGVLAFAGCEPPPIVDAPVPGEDYRTMLKGTDDSPAVAVGETAGQTLSTARTLPGLTPAPPTAKGETKTTASGTKYETVKEGKGDEVKAGQSVTVHYTGTLENGKVFDSSRERGQPTTFGIGQGQVIKGWDEAVPGMKVGETRKMTIPPNAAYGAQGKPPAIPPNATLIFEIEVFSAK